MTIKEYAEIHSITRQAVLYRIRKNKVKAKKNHLDEWVILESTPNNSNKSIELLEQEIYFLREKIEVLEKQIKEERKTNIELIKSFGEQQKIHEHEPKKTFLDRIINKIKRI